MVFDLNIWRHYLYGVCCTVYMDHKNLGYLMDQLNLNTRQHRWLDMVKDYHYRILYHPGKANMVANALSRKLEGSSAGEMCMRISIDSPLLDLIGVAEEEEVKKENWK